MDTLSLINNSKTIVVKIGSALLVESKTGTIKREWMDSIVSDISTLHKQGKEVIIVTSGAVALGRRYLKLGQSKLKLEEKQAAAAAGQIILAHDYQEALGEFGITVAQVLLTLEDSENRRRYLNASNTLRALLKLGAIPVINENDTVATEEIRFGDNDRLAARVAQMTGADVLVLFSDIDGLYTKDPTKDKDAKHIKLVEELTPEIESMAGGVVSSVGSGGMATKLMAARICMGAGCCMIIASGKKLYPLKALIEGGKSTLFVPSFTPVAARKKWIAGAIKPKGNIIVDEGAINALFRGKSLLPAGIIAVEGKFERGDAVIIKNSKGERIGKGLSAYSIDDAKKIIGHKSSEIKDYLGFKGRDEIIHRDDLVFEVDSKNHDE